MKGTVRIFTILLVVLTLVILAFSPVPASAAATAVSPPCASLLSYPARPSCIMLLRSMPAQAEKPAEAVAVNLTPEMLIAFAAVLLSILFDWLPGLKTWYDKFSDGQKRGIMAGLLVIVTGAVFGLSCAGWLVTGWLCNSAGIQDAVFLLILAVVVNQGFHKLTKP